MAAAGAVVAEASVVDRRPGSRPPSAIGGDVLDRHGAGSPFLNERHTWAPRPYPAMPGVSANDGAVTADGPAS